MRPYERVRNRTALYNTTHIMRTHARTRARAMANTYSFVACRRGVYNTCLPQQPQPPNALQRAPAVACLVCVRQRKHFMLCEVRTHIWTRTRRGASGLNQKYWHNKNLSVCTRVRERGKFTAVYAERVGARAASVWCAMLFVSPGEASR